MLTGLVKLRDESDEKINKIKIKKKLRDEATFVGVYMFRAAALDLLSFKVFAAWNNKHDNS